MLISGFGRLSKSKMLKTLGSSPAALTNKIDKIAYWRKLPITGLWII